MKRNISKALAILMTLALIMSLAAVSAFAVNGGTTKFEKEFAIPDGANMPNVEFEYAIEPGTAVPVGPDNEIAIYEGPTATVDGVDYPFIANAVFPSDDNSTNNHDNKDGTVDPDDSTKKIYIDNATIDLTGIEFTAAGVYRYVINEKTAPDITEVPGVTYEANTERYLDVFVFPGDHDNNPDTPDQLMVTEYSMTKNPSNFTKYYDNNQSKWVYTYTDPDARVKSSGYKNKLDTVDLEFAKTISGNQADTSKKFTFTLSITGANPNQEYLLDITGDNVIIADVEGVGSHVTNGKITTDANGAYTGTFSLTAGDKVKVLDLPVGYSYTLSEDAEDYTSTGGTAAGFTDGTVGQDGTISASAINADISTGFNNARTGIIPTGVILTVAPFMIGLLLFGAVMMFMISRRRRATY